MYTSVFLKKLLPLILCGIAFQLKAQVTLGVRGGYTLSWRSNITWTDTDEYIHKGGFQVSVLSYVNIGKRLSLGLEPGLVRRVTEAPTNDFFDGSGQKLLLNYFELPLMVSATYPGWGSRWEMSVKAGYGMSFLLSAFREIPSINGKDQTEKQQFFFNQGFAPSMNTTDHGVYGGFGIAYKIGNARFFVETDYYMGFEGVFIHSSHNRSGHFGAGYKIVL